jgi:DNA-binding PadR family transcriptional regulator
MELSKLEKKKLADKKYSNSEKGKLTRKLCRQRYESSEKGKHDIKRRRYIYQHSEQGKTSRQKWLKTIEGQLSLQKIEQSEKRKASKQKWKTSIKFFQWKKKYNNQPTKKIINRMRHRMWNCLNGRTNSLHTLEYLGSSPEDWKLYLERHGLKINDKNNHIDHIKPCSAFTWINVEQDLHECFHYTNTRLIPVLDNLIKHDRFDEEYQILYEYYKLNGPSILKTLKQRQQSKKAYDMAIINDILCKNA